jgi:hypothetical protein
VVSTSSGLSAMRASGGRGSDLALRVSFGRDSSSAFFAVTRMSPRPRSIRVSAFRSASAQLWPSLRHEQLGSKAFWYLKAPARRA